MSAVRIAYGSSLVGEIHLYKAKEKNRSKKYDCAWKFFSQKNENRLVFLKYEDGYGLRRKIYGKGKSGSGWGFRNSDSF